MISVLYQAIKPPLPKKAFPQKQEAIFKYKIQTLNTGADGVSSGSRRRG